MSESVEKLISGIDGVIENMEHILKCDRTYSSYDCVDCVDDYIKSFICDLKKIKEF